MTPGLAEHTETWLWNQSFYADILSKPKTKAQLPSFCCKGDIVTIQYYSTFSTK
jgi:hypothetical protein